MKKLITTSLCAALSLSAFGQGVVFFSTYVPGSVDAPVSRPDGTGAGAGINAQLVMVAANGDLVPLGPATTFRTTSEAAAYYVNPVVVSVPGFLPGTAVVLKMVAYSGNDFDTADLMGESSDVTVTLGGDVIPPPNLDGLRGFTLSSTLGTAPAITANPESQTVAPGSSVTFAVTASGSDPLGYQWQFNSVDIPNATAPTLTLAAAGESDAGRYRVVVRNNAGKATSTEALLKVQTTPPVASPTLHPADAAPADQKLTEAEAAGYAAAWKQGQTWPQNPNPIPASYVSRAGMLCLGGEKYQVDPGVESGAPLCWVNAPATAPTTSPADQPAFSQDRHSLEAMQDSDTDDEAESQADSESAADLEAHGAFVALVPDRYVPGMSITVNALVHPPAGTLAYVVEANVPEGWAVSNINEEGACDAVNNKVKWGMFADGTQRQLSFDLLAPTDSTAKIRIAGIASFDGHDIKLTGATRSASSSKLHHPKRNGHGGVDWTVTGAAGKDYAVEVSTDLEHWTRVKTFHNENGAMNYEDSDARVLKQKYLRVVELP